MRGFQERMRVISQSPVDVYIATDNVRYWYPYRLQHCGNAREAMRDECLSYIMDSGISNEELTNKDVLDAAHRLGASYIIPKDYLQDRTRTTESVREFFELYDEHPCSARPLVPLQPPFDKHYRELDGYSHYTLGGIRDEKPTEQLAAIRRFRDAAGEEPYAHALGLGCSLTLIRGIREEPSLLDSFDVSTPEKVVFNGKMTDKTWEQRAFALPTGEDSTTVRGAFAEAIAIELNYMLSPMCDDELLTSRYKQSTLPVNECA